MKKEKNIFAGDLIAKPGVVYEFEEITGHVSAEGSAADAFASFFTVE